MIRYMLIAGAGGFIGTCFRFLISRWVSGMFHGAFPIGTFVVNLIGCFIMGLVFGLLEKTDLLGQNESVLLTVGFCGGFTTFSSFANEMWLLGDKGYWATSGIYLAASVIMGILLVWLGRSIIR